jgi:hypothetical protein
MAYGCWIPLFRRERQDHILVGAPDHSFGVGCHSHVQLGGGGSAALTWLYHSLCDRVSKSGANVNLGGCMYLLYIWLWECFPVARPYRHDSPNSAVSHNALRAFAKVSMVSIFLVHRNVSSNLLYYR